MATVFFLLALIPAFYGAMIGGDFSQHLYKPSHKQVKFFLTYRWYMLGVSILLWLLGLIYHLQIEAVARWIVILSAALLALFIVAGFFMAGYIMFRSVRKPVWLPASEASSHYSEDEPVIGLEIDGDARAYPIDVVLRPHLVYDTVGGEAVTMTYCMLCNSAMAFKSEFERQDLEFMTPMQWENNLMIYSPGTEHLVQQLTRNVVGGRDDGKELETFPTRIMSWKAWRYLHPGTKILYHPPKKGFDQLARYLLRTKIHEPNQQQEAPIFPTITRFDSRLPNKAEVLGVCVEGSCKAYSIEFLKEQNVLNEELNGKALLVAFDPNLEVADVFEREHEGQQLSFQSSVPESGEFQLIDIETHSTWDMTGKAIAGPLKGTQLAPYTHYNRVFWYSWINFFPETELAAVALPT